jgi:asparagine synthase (glutamine-hydrolysing)
MLLDRDGYLPDDVLVKVDRATMAVSLESRAPLLDHRIIEFAASLPPAFLVQGGVTKRALREVLFRRVPRTLVDRPKQGFSVPLGTWLRAGLREWASDLIAASERLAPGVLDGAACQRMFAHHLAGRRDHSARLWPVLVYLAWAQRRPS